MAIALVMAKFVVVTGIGLGHGHGNGQGHSNGRLSTCCIIIV